VNNSNSSRQMARREAYRIGSKRTWQTLLNRWLLLLLMVFWIFAVVWSAATVSILTRDRASLGLLLFVAPPLAILCYIIKIQFPRNNRKTRGTMTRVTLSSEKEIYSVDIAGEKYYSYQKKLLLYSFGFLVSLIVLAVLLLGATQF
jgi:hypothetical protein